VRWVVFLRMEDASYPVGGVSYSADRASNRVDRASNRVDRASNRVDRASNRVDRAVRRSQPRRYLKNAAYDGIASRQKRIFLPSSKPRAT
jgi:hypothetical protein